MYLGNRHARVRDQRYDELIDAYVTTATKLFPNAMLHWEDFGVSNARRILNKYADQVCTFNDDMQGTAAVVLAAAFSGVRAAGTRLRDQRVVIHGAGTAGIGIADMMVDVMVREGLSLEEARRRFWATDRSGLITDDPTTSPRDFQVPYARPVAEVAGWSSQGDGISLADIVRNAEPTMLIGTSTQPAAFTEQIVKQMASKVERPIIMPLSNPTSKCEALPSDLIRWTEGRALVAAGSPFAPVTYEGRTYQIAQANNALIFPGLGLGVTVARASRVTDRMLAAAADAVAALSDATTVGASLLPSIDQLRMVSAAVGVASRRRQTRKGWPRQTSTTQSSRFTRRCGVRHIRRSSWSELLLLLGHVKVGDGALERLGGKADRLRQRRMWMHGERRYRRHPHPSRWRERPRPAVRPRSRANNAGAEDALWWSDRRAAWSCRRRGPSPTRRPLAAHGKLAFSNGMPLALASVSVRPIHAISGSV